MAEAKNEKQENAAALDNVSLAGIDIAQGRERYNGDAAYLEILSAWHLFTPTLLEIIKNPAPESLADYAIAVHGVKASSYGIFANDIGKRAQELEAFARAGDFSSVQALNDDFIKAVKALALELGMMLKKIAGGKEKQVKYEPDPVLLAQFLEAARRYKASAMEEVLDEMDLFDYETGGDLVFWLREQMDNLEYDEICAKLESYKARE
ncbi:MAG: hypothetical protein LBG95_00635 [Treponema sp.]|nr:hypothetical protein [Treponema sp.]